MDINHLMKPKTMAVVGASEKVGFSASICKNCLKLDNHSHIYFVNPKREHVFGKKCYKTLADIPEPVELTAIMVPKAAVNGILNQMYEIGCHAAVIFASGYSETGKAEDIQDEKDLKALAQKLEISIMGPNCAGYTNYIHKVPAFGMQIPKVDQAGNVGIISQSGQLCLNLIDMNKINFSYMISAGNSKIITMEDYLMYLVDDVQTKVIGLYLEGISNAKAFVEALRKASERKKPVIILKSGASKKGSQITSSHTGSLAGSDGAYNAVFKKYGVIRVSDMEELVSTLALFSNFDELPAEATFASINLSGGETGLCADLGERFGVEFPDFAPETIEKLTALLPSYSTPNNPLDSTATLSYDPESYAKLVTAVAEDPNTAMILCGLTILPDPVSTAAQCMTEGLELARKNGVTKPIAIVSFMECSRKQEFVDRLKAIHITVLPSTVYGFMMLKNLSDYINYQKEEHSFEDAVPDMLATEKPRALNEKEAGDLLKQYGVPVSPSMLVRSQEEMKKAEAEIGFPAVVKICSADILHKSDIGGVKVNINTSEELKSAYDTVLKNAQKLRPDAKIDGVLIQKMVPMGLELFVGLNVDKQFGPMLMVGMGGVFIEILKDAVLYPAPVNREEARRMLQQLKSYPLLCGYRGEACKDIEAVIDVMTAVSRLAAENKNMITELDINPLFVYENGVYAADALIVKKDIK